MKLCEKSISVVYRAIFQQYCTKGYQQQKTILFEEVLSLTNYLPVIHFQQTKFCSLDCWSCCEKPKPQFFLACYMEFLRFGSLWVSANLYIRHFLPTLTPQNPRLAIEIMAKRFTKETLLGSLFLVRVNSRSPKWTSGWAQKKTKSETVRKRSGGAADDQDFSKIAHSKKT